MSRLSKYQRVGRDSERNYAPWVRALSGKSGVYVIRERLFLGGAGEHLYIGESHSGKLYETLTRHFQQWTGPQSRTTYNRDDVLVAVKLTDADKAIAVQDGMICALLPRDNEEYRCGEEEGDVPF